MDKERTFIIAGLLLAALAVAAYLAYTFWAGPAGDRPTLMYFRANL
jgi:hypothetical protein